jgi:AhpD family alkylhydroperoxidase
MVDAMKAVLRRANVSDEDVPQRTVSTGTRHFHARPRIGLSAGHARAQRAANPPRHPGRPKPSAPSARGCSLKGRFSAQTKQLIAVAVAHVTQCPYCIRGHTAAALRKGVTAEQIMEAIWVAAEMRAGAAYAHSALATWTPSRTGIQ